MYTVSPFTLLAFQSLSALYGEGLRPSPAPQPNGDTPQRLYAVQDFPNAGESHVAGRQECLRNAVTRSPIGDLRLDGSAVMQTSSGE